MPNYTYECHHCNKEEDIICRYDDRNIQQCSRCGELSTFTPFKKAPGILSDEIKVSYSYALGRPISGREDWKRGMKEKNFNTDALDPY